MADDPGQKSELKAFHADILNDHKALKREQDSYKFIIVVRELTPATIQRNYLQLRQEVEDLANPEMEWIMGEPGTVWVLLKKG